MSAPLPAQYVGQARDLRRRLLASSLAFGQTAIGLQKELARHWYRSPSRKVDTRLLRGVVREWRASVPAFGRIGEPRIELAQNSLSIAEVRLLSADQRYSEWADAALEPAIVLQIVVTICNRHRFCSTTDPVGTFSLHALARRFQRGDGCNIDDIFRDAAALLRHRDRILPNLGPFEIPAPGGGYWVGENTPTATAVGDQPIVRLLLVRTYLAAHQLATAAAA